MSAANSVKFSPRIQTMYFSFIFNYIDTSEGLCDSIAHRVQANEFTERQSSTYSFRLFQKIFNAYFTEYPMNVLRYFISTQKSISMEDFKLSSMNLILNLIEKWMRLHNAHRLTLYTTIEIAVRCLKYSVMYSFRVYSFGSAAKKITFSEFINWNTMDARSSSSLSRLSLRDFWDFWTIFKTIFFKMKYTAKNLVVVLDIFISI